MAKKKSGPKKPRSARAEQRAALQELYAPATYSGLRDLLDIGKLDLKELRKYCTDARAKAVKVVVRNSLSGDCLFQGTDSSVLHTANCEDYIVEYFTAAYYTEPIIYVEVL